MLTVLEFCLLYAGIVIRDTDLRECECGDTVSLVFQLKWGMCEACVMECAWFYMLYFMNTWMETVLMLHCSWTEKYGNENWCIQVGNVIKFWNHTAWVPKIMPPVAPQLWKTVCQVQKAKFLLWYHRSKSVLWCEGDFVCSVIGSHQWKCLLTNGVSCSVRPVAFLKGRVW